MLSGRPCWLTKAPGCPPDPPRGRWEQGHSDDAGGALAPLPAPPGVRLPSACLPAATGAAWSALAPCVAPACCRIRGYEVGPDQKTSLVTIANLLQVGAPPKRLAQRTCLRFVLFPLTHACPD